MAMHLTTISAAIRRGLIEAAGRLRPVRQRGAFPRPFAAASLKHTRAKLEEVIRQAFPRPFAAASLKHPTRHAERVEVLRFPRPFAAASLKRPRRRRS